MSSTGAHPGTRRPGPRPRRRRAGRARTPGRCGRRRGARRARTPRSRRRGRRGRPWRRRGAAGSTSTAGRSPRAGATSAHQVARPCRTDASRRCTSSAAGGRGIRNPGSGTRAARHTVGELDRVEHRHPLVVLPHRVLARRRGRPPHDEPVLVDLDGHLPGERQLEDAVPPGADLAPPGADARGRVTVPLPAGEPHLQPDAPLHGGVHGVLRPVHRPAVQVEGERAPPPRRRAGEAAEAVRGGLEHAASAAPAGAPGPRGFG